MNREKVFAFFWNVMTFKKHSVVLYCIAVHILSKKQQCTRDYGRHH